MKTLRRPVIRPRRLRLAGASLHTLFSFAPSARSSCVAVGSRYSAFSRAAVDSSNSDQNPPCQILEASYLHRYTFVCLSNSETFNERLIYRRRSRLRSLPVLIPVRLRVVPHPAIVHRQLIACDLRGSHNNMQVFRREASVAAC